MVETSELSKNWYLYRNCRMPISSHERFWVQTSKNTPGALSIDQQKVPRRPGEFAGGIRGEAVSLYSLLGGRWVTFWDFGVLRQETEFRLYKLSLFGCQSNISAGMPCPWVSKQICRLLQAQRVPRTSHVQWEFGQESVGTVPWHYLGLRWEVGLKG